VRRLSIDPQATEFQQMLPEIERMIRAEWELVDDDLSRFESGDFSAIQKMRRCA